MVILNTDGASGSTGKGVAGHWESLRRQKYNFYEAKIRNSMEGIQKVKMGNALLNFFYPSFAQASLAELDIYRRLQILGDYTPEEVQAYKATNQGIGHHLNSTFGTPIPFLGLGLGAVSAGYLLTKPLNVLQAATLFVLFPGIQFLANRWNPRHKYETIKFLDWVEAQRTSKYLMERYKPSFSEVQLRDFKRLYPKETMLSAYSTYLDQLGRY